MTKKDYGLVLLLAMIFGLAGGTVASRFFMDEPVFAAKTPKPQKVITAEKFVLVDEDGVSRAVLGQYSKNKVGVGRVALALQDEKGNARIELAVTKEGVIGLNFFNKDGKPRASLVLSDNGGPVLSLGSKEGNSHVQLIIDNEGSPHFLLNGGMPGIDMFDKDGELLWSAP